MVNKWWDFNRQYCDIIYMLYRLLVLLYREQIVKGRLKLRHCRNQEWKRQWLELRQQQWRWQKFPRFGTYLKIFCLEYEGITGEGFNNNLFIFCVSPCVNDTFTAMEKTGKDRLGQVKKKPRILGMLILICLLDISVENTEKILEHKFETQERNRGRKI